MRIYLICFLCIFSTIAAFAQNAATGKSQFDQGKVFYDKKEYNKALPLFQQAAQNNNLNAMVFLGYCYENGLGTAVNYINAEEWYLKGAGKSSSVCALYLAKLYASNKIANQNSATAAKWYLQAANAGNNEAQNMVGRYYHEGWEPYKKNEKEAVAWYKKSAEQGYSKGQYNYGWAFYNGSGVEQNYEEAFKWFTKAADQNHELARLYLGFCYHYGRGADKDLKKAFDQFNKSMELGSVTAEDWIGFYYKNGYAVEKDLNKAFIHFTNAAKKGNSSAQYNLAQCYEYGTGTTKDMKKAVEWYKLSAEGENKSSEKKLEYLAPDFSKMTAEELYEKAENYLYNAFTIDSNPDSKLTTTDDIVISDPYVFGLFSEALTRSSDKGNSQAQNDLGSYYYFGEFGFQKDTKRGLALLNKSAQNNSDAQLSLGNIYYYGHEGTKKDYKTAFDWYILADKNGNKYAPEQLARCYEEGKGTKQNIGKAIEYYEKAGKKDQALKLKKDNNLLTAEDIHNMGIEEYNKGNYAEALILFEKNVQKKHMPSFALASLLYWNGNGIAKDEQKAFELSQEAASADNFAKLMTAYMYELGNGTSKNESKAFQMYKELVDEKYADAYFCLGDCYMDGIGTSKDPQKGFEFYLKAAEECGYARDYNNVGWCYLYGKGTDKDYTKALEYFNKAVEGGDYKISYIHLGTCYFYGWGVEQDYQKALSNYKLAIEGDETQINWNAFNSIGECYLLGLGVEQDYKEAVRMFEKAASHDNEYAYFNLALCYELGLGISSPNLNKSREYIKKAIDKEASVVVQTKGLDSNGNWIANVPFTKQNVQTQYTLKSPKSPSQIKATITQRTNNNITERTLAYERMDNKVFHLNLPSIFVSETEQLADNEKSKPVLPSIRIITPFDNATFSNAKVKFRYYTDTSEDAPVSGITVKVNGRLQPITESIGADGEIELDLPHTNCRIDFGVRNKYGNSPEETVNLIWKDPAEFIIKPNLYVLAIGINDYENFTPLKLPVKDMTDFVNVVKSKKNKPYRDIKIKTLADKEATRENIEEAFLWLSDEATTIDFTFIYFAGHGKLDEKQRFYLVPVDGDEDRLPTTCIRGNHFIDWLNDIPGKVIVFTDACHSGSLTEDTRSAADVDISVLVDLMHNAKNGVALYASSEAESVSRESKEWGNGAFTKVLLDVFSGDIKVGDKKALTTQDLLYYLNQGVSKVAKRQKPKFKVNEDFPLFLY